MSSRRVWTLEARARKKGATWWLAHSDFSLKKVREVQKAIHQNWREPHDFRVIRWGRA